MKTATAVFAIAVIALAMVAGNKAAQAELLHKHNFTRDTETGLDWLDLRDTAGYSLDLIQAGHGGFANAGWRLATEQEIQALFEAHSGIEIDPGSMPYNTWGDVGNATVEQHDIFAALVSCLTSTSDTNVPGEAPGVFRDYDGFTRLARAYYFDTDAEPPVVIGVATLSEVKHPNQTVLYWQLSTSTTRTDQVRYDHGVFLVRDSVGKIPNPKKHRCESN